MAPDNLPAHEASAAAAAVQPHTTALVIWDVPSAIVAGERFRVSVGIKCSAACDLTNGAFAIDDHDGRQVATGTLPGDLWPGTAGLYVAEVELQAPAQEGLYTWRVSGRHAELAVPHADGSTTFGVRVVTRPEHLVTIEAIDRDSGTPLPGARVVMHPYRAVTDERGTVQLRVAKGSYRLFVSQTRYLTFGLTVDVSADMTTRAELLLEPIPERN